MCFMSLRFSNGEWSKYFMDEFEEKWFHSDFMYHVKIVWKSLNLHVSCYSGFIYAHISFYCTSFLTIVKPTHVRFILVVVLDICVLLCKTHICHIRANKWVTIKIKNNYFYNKSILFWLSLYPVLSRLYFIIFDEKCFPNDLIIFSYIQVFGHR